MTSWPLVIERVIASSVPSSVGHASRASTSAVTLDVGMMGLPSSSHGSPLMSANHSRLPGALRTSSSHCERRYLPDTRAATTPSTWISVLSASPELALRSRLDQ